MFKVSKELLKYEINRRKDIKKDICKKIDYKLASVKALKLQQNHFHPELAYWSPHLKEKYNEMDKLVKELEEVNKEINKLRAELHSYTHH